MGMYDLHCDTILTCAKDGKHIENNDIHIDLCRLPKGMKYCQAFAIFILDNLRGDAAKKHFDDCFNYYNSEMERSGKIIGKARSYKEIHSCFDSGKFASLLTVEGGACIAGEIDMIDYLYECGVRIITLTWNGENEIGSGSVTNHGISDFGKLAVRHMEELGIIVDVSHLNDQGFSDICKIATKPFIATHSNSRAICNHLRNLTDEQFCEIRDRGGLVGMNYFHDFIKTGGNSEDISDLTAHIKHFLSLGGQDVIALGSDFDGAHIPEYINSIDKVVNLKKALQNDGISDEIIEKIFFDNADNFFKKYL